MPEQAPDQLPIEYIAIEQTPAAEIEHGHTCSAECGHGESINIANDLLQDEETDSLAPFEESNIEQPTEAINTVRSNEHLGHVCDGQCSHGESIQVSNELFKQAELSAPESTIELSTESLEHTPHINEAEMDQLIQGARKPEATDIAAKQDGREKNTEQQKDIEAMVPTTQISGEAKHAESTQDAVTTKTPEKTAEEDLNSKHIIETTEQTITNSEIAESTQSQTQEAESINSEKSIETDINEAIETAKPADTANLRDESEAQADTVKSDIEAEIAMPAIATETDISNILSAAEIYRSEETADTANTKEPASAPEQTPTNEQTAPGTEELSIEDALASVESALEQQTRVTEQAEYSPHASDNPPQHKQETSKDNAPQDLEARVDEEPVIYKSAIIAKELQESTKEKRSPKYLENILERHDISVSEQQLIMLTELLDRGETRRIHEYISSLMKLDHEEFQQEFLKNIYDDNAARAQQSAKHQRLTSLLRTLLPSLLAREV